MFKKDFLRKRLEVIQRVRDEFFEGVSLFKASSDILVPFDVDGTPLEVAKKVPFKPLSIPYTTFNNQFLIQQGSVTPIKTFHSDLFSVLSSLTEDDINKMFNSAPVVNTGAKTE